MWAAIVGVATWLLGLIFGRKENVARELGRSEVREHQATDALKSVQEAKHVEERTRDLSDSDLDRRVRRWERRPRDGQ